ncbi:6-carboxytetrahydropterin synthase QueD [bacterium]|nr:6-carboxytetrahydropterin synthase QueD [bacterium]
MFELKAQMYFSAAHHLLNYDGACENQHGHNWLVEAYVSGTKLDKSNILVDYKIIKKYLKEVLDYFDHKDINELPEFKEISPSSEILAKFIYEKMKSNLPQISKVSIWETPTSCASYFED